MQRSLIDEVEPSQQLLYWTLLFALYPFFIESSSFMLDRILSQQGAVRGSPGWEIDLIENDMGEWATSPRKVYHFINACMIRIQELETVNSKSDKILALQSKVNCALRCLINFNRLDYEDAFQRQYVTSLLNTQTTRVL